MPTDDTASVEKKLVGSHDVPDDDDADIVLAEYDSDTTITRGSCDTDGRCVNTVVSLAKFPQINFQPMVLLHFKQKTLNGYTIYH